MYMLTCRTDDRARRTGWENKKPPRGKAENSLAPRMDSGKRERRDMGNGSVGGSVVR